MTARLIHTIGHSNLAIEDFAAMLTSHGIGTVVDVRAWPESRRNPQFGQSRLKEYLAGIDIAYCWEGKSLGGHRKKSPLAAAHTALREELFRNYAAHMAGEAFSTGLSRIYDLAERRRIVLMCAERDPANCHRSFIADKLATENWQVKHIMDVKLAEPHSLSNALRLDDGQLVYDRQSQLELEGF